ncbi:MAG: amidohydrolase, partial [Oscillospiraceae bacterium]
MNTRFYNARIMPMENDCKIICGELWVNNDKILYIGDEKKTDIIFDREIDVQENLIIPGFKNAHTHSAMTFLRSSADDLPLQEWLEKQVFPFEAKLEENDVYTLSQLAILEYLTSGITSNFDMYFFPDAIAKASLDMGFRTCLCPPLNNFSSSLKDVENTFLKYNEKNSLISAVLGFHAEYTTDECMLKGLAALAKKYHAPVFTHNSETQAEVEGCIERHGKTPTQYLDSLGLFEYGGGGYHCVHFNSEDIEIFKKHKMYVVSNPASNGKLASGIAPLCDIEKAGVPIALGTDGAASNNCLDMFREMFLATTMQKLRYNDAAAMNADKVLQMACVNGANAMGLDECNCLAQGKKADLVILDMQMPNMQPINNIAKNI